MDMPERVSLALFAGAIGAALLIDMAYATSRRQSTGFDAQFIDMMVAHHQGAVELAGSPSKRAEHPEIARRGEAIITVQECEIGRSGLLNVYRQPWCSKDSGARDSAATHLASSRSLLEFDPGLSNYLRPA
jgi:uncharacterized protein (DUF305 family)